MPSLQHRQLEAFTAVMRTGSATRAAELRGVTQPAISRALVELERAIGFALFNRVRGRLIPTPEARLFFREVDVHFQGLARLEASAARILELGAGELKVASLPALGAFLIPKVVALYRARHPEQRISLQVQSSVIVRDLVAAGQCDIGLCSDEVNLAGVECAHFADYPLTVVMPADHHLTAIERIGPADLADEPLLHLDLGERLRLELAEAFAVAHVTPRIVVETSHSVTVASLTAHGAGIGLLNPVALDGLDRRGLVLRPFEPTLYFRKHLVFPPGGQRSRHMRAFLRALIEVRNQYARPLG